MLMEVKNELAEQLSQASKGPIVCPQPSPLKQSPLKKRDGNKRIFSSAEMELVELQAELELNSILVNADGSVNKPLPADGPSPFSSAMLSSGSSTSSSSAFGGAGWTASSAMSNDRSSTFVHSSQQQQQPPQRTLSLKRASTPSPTPRSTGEWRLSFGLVQCDSPEPLAKHRLHDGDRGSADRNAASPFSPPLSRAQNPLSLNSPFRDDLVMADGCELGLLSVSPTSRLCRRDRTVF